MNRVGKIALYIACELALNAGLHAATPVSPGNPYTPIVTRNVFDLNPPQPVAATPSEPPPKITPNGIMTIFGSPQVLFKVSIPAKPGQPAKDDSYILAEGQRQDDITVTHIDEKSGMVTFNNHGTVQQIPLTAAPGITAPGVASFAANPVPNIPNGYNGHNENNGGRGFGRFGGRIRNTGNVPNNSIANGPNNSNENDNNNSDAMGSDSNPEHPTVQNPLAGQIPPGLTPEEQTILIEANRLATQSQVDKGEMPSLPITELTPQ